MDSTPLDLLATGVLLLDDGLAVRRANLAAEELLGASRRQLLGTSGDAWFAADARWREHFARAARGARGVVSQTVACARTGQTLNLVIVPLRAQPWRAVLELRHIERQALLERQQLLAGQLDAQRESLRNLAHEIKNPLGGLRGAAQLAESEFDVPGLREYTRVIVAEADRLSALVDRLLVSQEQPGATEKFNIHEICERVRTLIAAEFGAGIQLLRDYDVSVPDLEGDPARLLQVLLNIVRNAAQALAENPVPAARIVLRTRVGGGAVIPTRSGTLGLVLSVIDNGPGVPGGLREKIFHPLVTGRASGSGLGLSIAQAYAHQMGGLLEFESRPGHTEFRLILSLERA
ncbi:MAG: PAS domain-containing sensor histidine kinase [Candidimonas sp.]|nr:MAG: PAS domain-containing sensor histidine kinase [Candidimonas sp.]